jgi:hypothetical protein
MARGRMNIDRVKMDDELRRLVAVVPSPEFEARVRARVADIEMASARGWWWWAATVATASLVIAAVALTPRRAGDERLAVTSFAPPIAALHPAWSSTVARTKATATTVAPAVMKVIVQRGQAAALIQFAALSAAGHIVEDAASGPASVVAPEQSSLAPLTIAPVTIEPLAPPATSGDPK